MADEEDDNSERATWERLKRASRRARELCEGADEEEVFLAIKRVLQEKSAHYGETSAAINAVAVALRVEGWSPDVESGSANEKVRALQILELMVPHWFKNKKAKAPREEWSKQAESLRSLDHVNPAFGKLDPVKVAARIQDLGRPDGAADRLLQDLSTQVGLNWTLESIRKAAKRRLG